MSVLNRIEFTRYKAFADLQSLELRPVTLLFGRNSAGKSAALRLIQVLADAAASRRPGATVPSVFDYQSVALRGARFEEIAHGGKASPIQIGLVWDDLAFYMRLNQLDRDHGEVVIDFDVVTESVTINGILTSDSKQQRYEVFVDGERNPPKGPYTGWTFDGLLPKVEHAPQRIGAVAALLHKRLAGVTASTHWIASVRAQPPRFFVFGPGTEIAIKHDGSGVAAALRWSSTQSDGVIEAVSQWLTIACGYEMSLTALDAQVAMNREWYPFTVRAVGGSGQSVAVQDVGEGIAQALPVVTLCQQARLGLLGATPVLAFEQPELHLHPRAAMHLSDMLLECVAKGSPAVHIVETHSESFLLSLQIALAEKRIRPDQAIVYWVDADQGSSSLRPITFDEEGYPTSGWPEGVFREALEQARRLAHLRS